jgi:hypothetical protein
MEKINSRHYIRTILFQSTDQDKKYGHFMQHSATAYTANNSMNASAKGL